MDNHDHYFLLSLKLHKEKRKQELQFYKCANGKIRKDKNFNINPKPCYYLLLPPMLTCIFCLGIQLLFHGWIRQNTKRREKLTSQIRYDHLGRLRPVGLELTVKGAKLTHIETSIPLERRGEWRKRWERTWKCCVWSGGYRLTREPTTRSTRARTSSTTENWTIHPPSPIYSTAPIPIHAGSFPRFSSSLSPPSDVWSDWDSIFR